MIGHKSVSVIPVKLEIDQSHITTQLTYDTNLHDIGIVSPLNFALVSADPSKKILWSESSPAANALGTISNKTINSSIHGSYTQNPISISKPVMFSLGGNYDFTIRSMFSGPNSICNSSNCTPVTTKVQVTVPSAALVVDLPATVANGAPGCGVVPAKTVVINVVRTAGDDTYFLSAPGYSATTTIKLIPDGSTQALQLNSSTETESVTFSLKPDLTISGTTSWRTSTGCVGSRTVTSASGLVIAPGNKVTFGKYDYGTFSQSFQ